ncbi:MAG: hydroxymethylglutaryl-CoA lyase [Phaeovulum sp.]|uniref:hydroxymethylglutaryl-CoA lyase n=1 Tax=Phaeovulum sp. TaxID=2934796 RepID=UPI0027365B2D|nr:hydroxymethylglutaryl-CoA lyase [Phaeovulum sp.]MDP3860617.1 hydroxymethylglutaryl-CoA lyase [Phaeovulum sp.]
MYHFGGKVLIEDEFLRDGLQNEARAFTVAEKLHYLDGLAAAGLKRIQVGSFVHPEWVPQMANTDAVFATLLPRPGVTYTALILNMAGLDRALAAGVRHLSVSVSASETHSRKNLNKSVAEARAQIVPILERALAEGIAVRAGIQSALGCGFEGPIDPASVTEIARAYGEIGVHEVNIADTAGLANPVQVHALCAHVREVLPATTALSLHLHDTRGLGLANMVAGLEAGVRIFDAALGGLGGCPFIPAATGNIATEDAAFALAEMGLSTGIDYRALGQLTRELEATLGRRLPGRMAHIDTGSSR